METRKNPIVSNSAAAWLRDFVSLLLFAVLVGACGQLNSVTGLPTNQSAGSISPTETQLLTETHTPEPTAVPQASFPDSEGYAWNLIVDGFSRPLLVTNAGDGSRLFVLEQGGVIRIVQDGAILPQPFLDVTAQIGSGGNEQGLLGLAFHPDYEQNGLFYINYTDLNGDTVISRFQTSEDPNVADLSSEKVLLQVDQPYANHNGGNLVFGPDRFLYAGLGDGGSQGDPNGNGQSLDTYLGKILRIDVNSGDPYGVPADNPFASGGGLPEIWDYGFRNPWRFNFDIATGDLYIADVGQNQWEEVDFAPASNSGGLNFGWNYMEGTHSYQGDAPEGLTTPVVEYDHSSRCSITGGYVYRGQALPAWQGVYFYGDYCSGEIFGLVHNADGRWESRLLYDTGFLITSFGTDEAGEIYLVDRNGGIYQLQGQ